MEKVLVQLTSKGAKAKRDADRKDVAFGLADLSSHEELLEKFGVFGSIKTLINLLTKTLDHDTQRFASLGLANVASLLLNANIMKAEEYLLFLIEFIADQDGDLIARQFASMCLGNLAAFGSTHDNIGKFNGIDALLILLKTQDIEGGKYASFALANLAINSEYRQQIVEKGAVPDLIFLASCENVIAQKQALTALKAIGMTKKYLKLLINKGILDPLILLSRNTDDVELLEEISYFYNVLSTEVENRKTIAEKSIIPLISLVMNTNIIVEENSTCAIANIMEQEDLHYILIANKGIVAIVTQLYSKSLVVRGNACRCIANLAINPKTHESIFKQNVFEPLFECFLADDMNCQRYSTLSVANFSSYLKSQLVVIESHSIYHLVAVVNVNSVCVEAKRYSILALSNLATTPSNYVHLIKSTYEDNLTALVVLNHFDIPDLLANYYLACLIANLSGSKSNHSALIENNVFTALSHLCEIDNTDIYTESVISLRNLSCIEENKQLLFDEVGIEHVIRGIKNNDESLELVKDILACINNLSVLDDVKKDLNKFECTPIFDKLIHFTDVIIVEQSCSILANMAKNKTILEDIISQITLKQLLILMKSKNYSIKHEAGRVISHLCCSKSNFTQTIVDSGGIILLLSFLNSNSSNFQIVGGAGLLNLSNQQKYHSVLFRCGILESYISILRSEIVLNEVKRIVLLSISNLAKNFDNHIKFINEGLITVLTSLSVSDAPKIIFYSAYCLTRIANNFNMKEFITDEGGLQPILFLVSCGESRITYEMLKALSNLSTCQRNKILICRDENAVTFTINSLKTNDKKNIELAFSILANLSEEYVNINDLVQHNVISILTEFSVENENDEIKYEWSRCVGNYSVDHDCSLALNRNIVIKELVMLINNSSNTVIKKISSFAICNLSSSEQNHEELFKYNLVNVVFENLQTLLNSKSLIDLEFMRYCLLILSNITSSLKSHEIITKYMNTLLSFTTHGDIKCRQNSVFCYSNLCLNQSLLESIAKSGILKVLITFTFPSPKLKKHVQFKAVSGLRGISTTNNCCKLLIQEGGIESLITATESDSEFIQKEALETIQNLSLSKPSIRDLIQSGILKILRKMANSTNIEIKELVYLTLANISENIEEENMVHDRIFQENLFPFLIESIKLNVLNINRQIFRMFSLFSSRLESHHYFIQNDDFYKAIISFFNEEDADIIKYIHLTIANICFNQNVQQKIIEYNFLSYIDKYDKSENDDIRKIISFENAIFPIANAPKIVLTLSFEPIKVINSGIGIYC